MRNANNIVPYLRTCSQVRKTLRQQLVLERSDKFKVPLYLDFSFCFPVPNPRYERIITQKVVLGG